MTENRGFKKAALASAAAVYLVVTSAAIGLYHSVSKNAVGAAFVILALVTLVLLVPLSFFSANAAKSKDENTLKTVRYFWLSILMLYTRIYAISAICGLLAGFFGQILVDNLPFGIYIYKALFLAVMLYFIFRFFRYHGYKDTQNGAFEPLRPIFTMGFTMIFLAQNVVMNLFYNTVIYIGGVFDFNFIPLTLFGNNENFYMIYVEPYTKEVEVYSDLNPNFSVVSVAVNMVLTAALLVAAAFFAYKNGKTRCETDLPSTKSLRSKK